MTTGGLVNTTAKLVFSQPTTWNWISRLGFGLKLYYFLCTTLLPLAIALTFV
jgi:hypothetical protein